MTSPQSTESSIDQTSPDTVTASAGSSTSQSSSQRPRPLSLHHPPVTPLETVHEPEAKEPFSPTPKPPERPPRPLSFSARNGNRLSLNFPVQPQFNPPPSADSTTVSFPPTPAETHSAVLSPSDPVAFLTALAAQERKVLEIKDELRRAEADLDRLKRQWERQQGQRRIGESLLNETLPHLQTGTPNDVSGSESDDTTRRTLELDRRKALLENMPTESRPRRKIIRGGHTRTLSLLSPDKMHSPSFPSVKTVHDSQEPREGLTRSSTVSDMRRGSGNMSANADRHSYQNGVGMKQIAEGFKTGLYNFMEDLRQATVGDEAINGTGLRPIQDQQQRVVKKVSRGNLAKSGRARSPNSQGTNTVHAKPKERREVKKRSLSKPAVAELDDDDWENWESPSAKAAAAQWLHDQPAADYTSLIVTDRSQASSTPSNDPDSTVPAVDPTTQRTEISWSSLNNLNLPASMTPTRIKQSAEAFMREWEKSLSVESESSSTRPSMDTRADAQLIEGL